MKTFTNKDGQTETEVELKEKYNPEGSSLRILQNEVVKMLLWFDSVCKENNIEYFIGAGNILGAVRHGGFIPWDDDADVYMMEKECKKLQKVLMSPKYKDADYVLQNHKTDKGYYAFWPVIRHKKSEYIKDDRVHNARKYRGFQIDVFPVAERRSMKLSHFFRKFERLNNKYFIGKKNFKFMASFLYYFEKIILIPIFKIFSFIFCWKYKGYLFHANPSPFYKTKFKISDTFPLGTVKFEGYDFPAPNNIEGYLKSVYGDDYMTLSSPKERMQHSVIEYKMF